MGITRQSDRLCCFPHPPLSTAMALESLGVSSSSLSPAASGGGRFPVVPTGKADCGFKPKEQPRFLRPMALWRGPNSYEEVICALQFASPLIRSVEPEHHEPNGCFKLIVTQTNNAVAKDAQESTHCTFSSWRCARVS